MKLLTFTLIFSLCCTSAYTQWEITSGYAVNKNLADGTSANLAYDFKVSNRLYAKPQIGYKYLHHFNDFVGATIRVSIVELHQTISYEIIKTRKYIFKPNIGLNYRFYSWKGEMKPLPDNDLPVRAWSLEFRNREFLKLESINSQSDTYKVSNLGFSIQLQNQFRLTDKVWLHITPFIEPDYDGSQNTGGCYVGVILKSL